MSKSTKTARLLKSFQSVELTPEHINYGDEGPCLREYGIAGSTATALIRWGETETLVCYFENARGVTPNIHHWTYSFLKAAFQKHVDIFGQKGLLDIPKVPKEMLELRS